MFLLSCKRVSKTVGLLGKFQDVLSRASKLFIRPYLDHGDIIHDRAYNFIFHQKLESFQYNAFLAIAGTIRRNIPKKTPPGTGPRITSNKEMIQGVLLLCEDLQ